MGETDFKLLGITFHVELDRIQRINYTEKIHKIKNLIILWKRRNLTPLGKITVIKNFASADIKPFVYFNPKS